MPELKFQPPLWISLYITAIQYFVISVVVVAAFAFIDINNEPAYSIAFAIFIPVATVLAVTYESHKAGIITFSLQGLSGYSFKQFVRENHYLSWSEIYKVERYRYFGLRFLLVRFHSFDRPLWLPLFLKNQTKLNLAILEQTREDNPLHIALTEKIDFAQVPWHSWTKKHKSDIYILESAYTEKIYNSFKQYCVSFIIPLWLLIGLLALTIEPNILSKLFWINFAVVSSFTVLPYFLFWYLFVKNKYIAIENEEIEIYSQVGSSFVPWSEIREVRSYGVEIFKELRFFLREPINQIRFVAIRLCFLDRHSLRKAVLKTHPKNPLHETVVKYL